MKDLTADKEVLVSELVAVNKTAAHARQDFKRLVKCLKASEPLQAITDFLEEAGSDSGLNAHSSELNWVMRRLCDLFKQTSGTVCGSTTVLLTHLMTHMLYARASCSAAFQ